VADLFREKSTASWWLISRTNRLAQPVPTVNPFTRLPVKENRGLACVEEFPYPGAPAFREPSAVKDVNQTVPVDTVEGLMEIKLQNYGGAPTMVATVE
jgi:hypothetical protein